METNIESITLINFNCASNKPKNLGKMEAATHLKLKLDDENNNRKNMFYNTIQKVISRTCESL